MDGEVVFIEGPIDLRIDGSLIFAEVHSGNRIITFAATAPDFLESFARAAEVAHKWTTSNLGSVVPIAKGVHSSRRTR